MSVNGGRVVCAALDVGATKLGVALVGRDGALERSAEALTPKDGDNEAVFAAVTGLLDALLGEEVARVMALGVGCAGPMTDGAEVSPLNIPGWRGFPLRRRLSERYGLPTFLELDTKALALAEGWKGAARGVDNFLAMVVSTGIGGGLVLDGRLVDGRTGNAGHVGHMVVVPDGRPCSCGGRGCLEAEASGWAIAAITGRPPHEAGPEMVERTGRLVGRALASVANLCDLDLFVVAGSVAFGYGDAFFEAAGQALGEGSRQSYTRSARVVPAGLGAQAPVVGCGAVAWRGLGEDILAPAPLPAA
jgi:glucokinase